MEKIILTLTAVAGASLSGYSQGQINFENANAAGYVTVSPNGDTSAAVSANYAIASSFDVECFSLNVASTAGLTGLDAYGYLATADLTSDGFTQDALGGSMSPLAGSAGAFGPVTATVNGVTSANAAIAVVAWLGNYGSLAEAEAGGSISILVFEQAIGPASPSPFTQDISAGWNSLDNSPQSAANGGVDDLIITDLDLNTPEPSTVALAGLGSLSLFLLRRKK